MNIAAQAAADEVARLKFSVEDVNRMLEAGILSEDDPIELVEGDFVVMAAKHIGHERIKSALIKALARFVPDELEIGVEASIQLSQDTLVEPDIAVIASGLYRADPKSFLNPAPGDIPLIIEVAVSSLNYDRRTKARLYAAGGIPEFWVIDANMRTTWVHVGPSAGKWGSIVERKADETITSIALPGFACRLSDFG